MDELEMEGEYALVLGDESTYGEDDGPNDFDDQDECEGCGAIGGDPHEVGCPNAWSDDEPEPRDDGPEDLPEGTHLSITFEGEAA